MSAQVEELGENRVRLTVDVSPHELEHAVEHAVNDLSESVKIPGFRKGKVPTPVLISKIGKDRITTVIGTGYRFEPAVRAGVVV